MSKKASDPLFDEWEERLAKEGLALIPSVELVALPVPGPNPISEELYGDASEAPDLGRDVGPVGDIEDDYALEGEGDLNEYYVDQGFALDDTDTQE